jgi:hypothetical protein
LVGALHRLRVASLSRCHAGGSVTPLCGDANA